MRERSTPIIAKHERCLGRKITRSGRVDRVLGRSCRTSVPLQWLRGRDRARNRRVHRNRTGTPQLAMSKSRRRCDVAQQRMRMGEQVMCQQAPAEQPAGASCPASRHPGEPRPESANASTTSRTPVEMRRTASRSHIRNSVATWSFRERPARRRPPTSGPTRSIRPRSSAPCTSSSESLGPKAPLTTSAARRSRPSSIVARSASLSRPALFSTRACACDARTSYGARTQSK